MYRNNTGIRNRLDRNLVPALKQPKPSKGLKMKEVEVPAKTDFQVRLEAAFKSRAKPSSPKTGGKKA